MKRPARYPCRTSSFERAVARLNAPCGGALENQANSGGGAIICADDFGRNQGCRGVRAGIFQFVACVAPIGGKQRDTLQRALVALTPVAIPDRMVFEQRLRPDGDARRRKSVYP
ncbi:MAG: hypothetical protein JWQ72_1835 [Polaromonas sp.]|nr:hypothetical protein [Polaromonas sp.]